MCNTNLMQQINKFIYQTTRRHMYLDCRFNIRRCERLQINSLLYGKKHATGPHPEPVQSSYNVMFFLLGAFTSPPLGFLDEKWFCSESLVLWLCGRVIGTKVGYKIDRNCLLTGCRQQDTTDMPRFMTPFSENGRQPQARLPDQKPVLRVPFTANCSVS
jgi:hypothetical protein